MSYSAPPNFTAGQIVTDVNLDVLSDDITFLANPPKCRVYNSAAISITTSGTDQALTFNSERYDTDTLHSTAVNTGRVTITTAGTYDVGAAVDFAASATGYRTVYLRLNGSTIIASQKSAASPSGTHQLTVTTQYPFAAGDYIEVVVVQSSGAALNVNASGNYSPEFWAIWRSL